MRTYCIAQGTQYCVITYVGKESKKGWNVQGRMARFYAKKTNSLLGLEEPTYGHQAVGTGP